MGTGSGGLGTIWLFSLSSRSRRRSTISSSCAIAMIKNEFFAKPCCVRAAILKFTCAASPSATLSSVNASSIALIPFAKGVRCGPVATRRGVSRNQVNRQGRAITSMFLALAAAPATCKRSLQVAARAAICRFCKLVIDKFAGRGSRKGGSLFHRLTGLKGAGHSPSCPSGRPQGKPDMRVQAFETCFNSASSLAAIIAVRRIATPRPHTVVIVISDPTRCNKWRNLHT